LLRNFLKKKLSNY